METLIDVSPPTRRFPALALAARQKEAEMPIINVERNLALEFDNLVDVYVALLRLQLDPEAGEPLKSRLASALQLLSQLLEDLECSESKLEKGRSADDQQRSDRNQALAASCCCDSPSEAQQAGAWAAGIWGIERTKIMRLFKILRPLLKDSEKCSNEEL